MASREPSVSSLAEALTRTAEPDLPPRVAIAKPRNLVRVLVAGVLVLTLIFVAALLMLSARISQLVIGMRAQEAAITFRETAALPAADVLADGEATRKETVIRPLAAGPIWRARCAYLAEQGDWAGLDATCVQVRLVNPGDLLPATKLLHAEALIQLGRWAEAGRILHQIDQSQLDNAGRERSADLAGKLWLAPAVRARPEPAASPSVERSAEQVRESTAEGTH